MKTPGRKRAAKVLCLYPVNVDELDFGQHIEVTVFGGSGLKPFHYILKIWWPNPNAAELWGRDRDDLWTAEVWFGKMHIKVLYGRKEIVRWLGQYNHKILK